jgi:uncharacterized protein (DUF486 family)
MATILLLILSNIFMTIAWYGHLKHMKTPLGIAIITSWGIALLEYVFQVPANRLGYGQFSLMQLKIIQECITLCVFTIFAFLVFRVELTWNYFVAYLLLCCAVFFAFLKPVLH